MIDSDRLLIMNRGGFGPVVKKNANRVEGETCRVEDTGKRAGVYVTSKVEPLERCLVLFDVVYNVDYLGDFPFISTSVFRVFDNDKPFCKCEMPGALS